MNKQIILNIALTVLLGAFGSSIAMAKKPAGVSTMQAERKVLHDQLTGVNAQMLDVAKEARDCRATATDGAGRKACNDAAAEQRKALREEARGIASQMGDLRPASDTVESAPVEETVAETASAE